MLHTQRGELDPPAQVSDVLLDLLLRPGEYLIRRWHWKAAIFSAMFRCVLFICANLSAGWEAAWGAGLTEFFYRLVASGFYGSMTQSFRRAEPVWLANVTAMFLLPVFQHALEFFIHWMRGTPRLGTSLLLSATFTIFSTLFNLYSMRRGSLVVGSGGQSIWRDIVLFPNLLCSFVADGFRQVTGLMKAV